MKLRVQHIRVIRNWLVAATWCALLASGCGMPELTHTSSAQFPTTESCAHCHVDIYAEWEASPHARAFVDPRFVAATDHHKFQSCLPCHAPDPILATPEPVTRTVQLDSGVACASCHLDHGAMVGPLPPTGMVQPHPVRVDPAPFADGQLCGRCHQGTLAQWQAADHASAGDCRQCHMPSVVRKTTQATSELSKVFVAAEKAVPEHQHSFSLIPTTLPSAPFTLELTQDNGQAHLKLSNHLPHNLPTGDFGVRIIEVTADARDADHHMKPLGHWELSNAGGGFLRSDASRDWSITVPADARSVHATMARLGRDGADRIVLLEKEVAIP